MSAKTARDQLAAVLLAAVFFFGALGARDLWNPNEPTYGQAVAEMSARGEWAIPRVGGQPFAEKTILYFWAARVAAAATGLNEWSLRAPQAACGVFCVWLLFRLAHRSGGRRRAWYTVGVFATTFMVYWGARSIQMDFLVATTTLAAIAALLSGIEGRRPRGAAASLAGLAVGLGLLAKGPVAAVLPGLIALVALASIGRLAELRRVEWWWAGIVAAAVALPWYVYLALAGHGDLLHEMLIRQNITRFLAPWDHVQPWWYYLGYFWNDMAPWAFVVPLAWKVERADDDARRLHRFAWVWLVVVLTFFSLSASKRSAYILPLAPAVALLAGAVLDRYHGVMAGRRRAGLLVLIAAMSAALAAGGLALLIAVPARYPELAAAAGIVGTVAGAGGLGALASFALPRARRHAPVLFLLSLIAIYTSASWVGLPAVNALKSPRVPATAIAARLTAGEPLASFGFWKWRAGLRFYLRRELPDLTASELREYWSRDRRSCVVVLETRRDEAAAVVDLGPPEVESRAGAKTYLLFCNRPAGR